MPIVKMIKVDDGLAALSFPYDAVNGNPHLALGQGLDLLNGAGL